MLEASESHSKFISSQQKRKGFHAKYLHLCKSDNIQPASEVKSKSIYALDFHGDRLRPYDWITICNALSTDTILKFLAIRLRKINGFILEEIDTLKKSKTLVNHPVILSKFLFGELMDALQKFFSNNQVIEELILEGLPLNATHHMPMIVNSIRSNQSIKSLSFSRCNIGDEACELLCSNIKHMLLVETINLSNCALSSKGAESIMKFIKLQKIHRFSDAWISSLRYQNAESVNTGGIKKIIINNNLQVGDEGLKLITDELKEDTWITEIEMQNCGLSDIAAEHILNCLASNRSIINFDVSNNALISNHYSRQILLHFHRGGDSGSNSSTESLAFESSIYDKAISKGQLIDKIKSLELRLELETKRNQEYEELSVYMHNKVNYYKNLTEEYQKQSKRLKIPEGFTLIRNELIEEILAEKIEKIISFNVRRHKNKHLQIIKKQRALKKFSREINNKGLKTYSAQTLIQTTPQTNVEVSEKKPLYIETNIGDYFHNDEKPLQIDEHSKVNNDEIIDILFPKK
ncbi:hypothetical protein PVAND_007767 [Polypedilum vanderplanki]|uniref:Uncharacterized protein n=1 Tax=Polypedilum vanderplanki TaxID=319348 RepID=A0A9J6C7M0_POLVA|nr:hypothetical protein PVAND_007767 [Polypedilum vanderplanki]